MKFWIFTFVLGIAFLSICVPEQFINAIKYLNAFFSDLGITSFDDLADSGKDLLDELKGKF